MTLVLILVIAYSVIFIHTDNFREYSNRFGHAISDNVLRSVRDIIKEIELSLVSSHRMFHLNPYSFIFNLKITSNLHIFYTTLLYNVTQLMAYYLESITITMRRRYT